MQVAPDLYFITYLGNQAGSAQPRVTPVFWALMCVASAQRESVSPFGAVSKIQV